MIAAVARLSGVQQVSTTSFPERGEPVMVRGQDFRIRQPFSNSLERPVISEQANVCVDFPGVRIGSCEVSRDLESDPQRVESFTIGDGQSNTATSLAGKLARVRCEASGFERYTGKGGTVQIGGQCRSIDPGRTDNFKRRVGAAPDRHIGRLEQADTGIQNRLGKAADIWRWVDPWEFSCVEIFATLPALQFNNLQVDIDGHFRLEKASELTHGHAVTNREAMEADERLLAVVQHRARDVNAVDRVRAVENNKSDVVVGSRLHRVTHRRNIGIEARTDVLDIKHNGIDSIEHFRSWPSDFSVKTEDLNSGAGIDVIINNRDVELPAKAVFRAKYPHELNIFGVMQKENGALPVSVDAGVVGDQRDPVAMQRLEIVARQNVDASQHGCVVAAGNQQEQRAQKSKWSAEINDSWAHHFQIEQHNYPTRIVVQCQKN